MISACVGQKQVAKSTQGGTIPRDDKTIELIGLGKKFLKAKQYGDAAHTFESATTRPFNQATTASIYLAGLSYFYMGDDYFATQRFNQIITEYPKSRYADDSRYHKGIILLKNMSSTKKMDGMDLMLGLGATAKDESLAKEAQNTSKHYLFYEFTADDVAKYYQRVRTNHKLTVLEALCFHKVSQGDMEAAKRQLKVYESQGGKASPFLQALFDERKVAKYVEKDIMKIGVFLPLYLDSYRYDTTLNAAGDRNRMALEFYEGFQKAVDTYAGISKKKIYVKVFDTQRNSAMVSKQLVELDAVYPDVVVGEIYSQQTRVISDWAEKRGIPQFIPLNPTSSLVDGKSYVFLTSPSTVTHGKRMAEYARSNLGLQRVAVFTDGKAVTEEIANSYINTFDTLGGEVIRLFVDKSEYGRRIPQLVRSLSIQNVDGVYFPINDEEMADLLLSSMRSMKALVMGTPHWQNFKVMHREDKERVNLLFSSASLPENNNPDFLAFYNSHTMSYGLPPSDYHIQGYDLGLYLVSVLDEYNPKAMPLTNYIKERAPYQGIQLDYEFKSLQSNQGINICQYTRDGIVKVNP